MFSSNFSFHTSVSLQLPIPIPWIFPLLIQYLYNHFLLSTFSFSLPPSPFFPSVPYSSPYLNNSSSNCLTAWAPQEAWYGELVSLGQERLSFCTVLFFFKKTSVANGRCWAVAFLGDSHDFRNNKVSWISCDIGYFSILGAHPVHQAASSIITKTYGFWPELATG